MKLIQLQNDLVHSFKTKHKLVLYTNKMAIAKKERNHTCHWKVLKSRIDGAALFLCSLRKKVFNLKF